MQRFFEAFSEKQRPRFSGQLAREREEGNEPE